VGQPLFELHTNTPDKFAAALADLDGAIRIAPAGSAVDRPALVQDVITAGAF
jgi:thymidine phosphorylase